MSRAKTAHCSCVFLACWFLYIYFYCELCYRGFQKTLMSQVNFLQNPSIVFWKQYCCKILLGNNDKGKKISVQQGAHHCFGSSDHALSELTALGCFQCLREFCLYSHTAPLVSTKLLCFQTTFKLFFFLCRLCPGKKLQ